VRIPDDDHKSGSWRNSVATVHDTPAFREMIAEGRAIRESDIEGSGDRIDQDNVEPVHPRFSSGSLRKRPGPDRLFSGDRSGREALVSTRRQHNDVVGDEVFT
jgi:hypothetical protein